MSYGLVFAPDARIDWRRLDVSLQEVVLDELDGLCDDPAEGPSEDVVYRHEWMHEDAAGQHYLFLSLAIVVADRSLLVLGVGRHERGFPLRD